MANEERFTGLAQTYSKYRPGYPAALVEYLATACGLETGSPVADIGAGTGIFTRMLLQAGFAATAVEPNADMREELAKTLAPYPAARIVAAPAEDTGLPAASVRLVTAAQAYHWFDKARYKQECARILAPGGKAAVLWNTRDPHTAIAREYHALCAAHNAGQKEFKPELGHMDAEYMVLFRHGEAESRVFPNPQRYDWDGFVGHALSGSYSPRAGQPGHEAFYKALAAFFAAHSRDGVLEMPMVTELFLGEV